MKLKYLIFFILINIKGYAQTDIWLYLSSESIKNIFSANKQNNLSLIDIILLSQPNLSNSITNILDKATFIDIQHRNPFSIQGDITIRGSSFNQTLLLIDGLRLNDRQTSHHNLDLPITSFDIEQIELLNTNSNLSAGPDALSGAINFKLKKHAQDNLNTNILIGDFNTKAFAFSHSKNHRNIFHQISFEKSISDGYKYDTDFDKTVLSSILTLKDKTNEFNLFLGFSHKIFGAFDFYTPKKNLPSKEWTKTYFSKFSYKKLLGTIALEPTIYFRKHDDNFILDISKPTYYYNEHKKYSFGTKIETIIPININSKIKTGLDIFQNSIESNRLPSISETKEAVFFIYQNNFTQKLKIEAGSRLEDISSTNEFLPSFVIGYQLNKRMCLSASVSKSIRFPSFTELYYKDPINEGNPSLKPEKSISYDLLFNYKNLSNFFVQLNFFIRDEDDIIDWVGYSQFGPWKAENKNYGIVYGLETITKTNTKLCSLTLKTSSIKDERKTEYFSKYLLNYAKNKISLEIEREIFKNFLIELSWIHKNFSNNNSFNLINISTTKKLKSLIFIFTSNNILDQKYEEIIGVPQPGRWFGLEISYKFL